MFVKNIEKYDGCLLHQRFAYRFFREKCSPLGNMIAFRAPMEVLAEGMIDQEDVLNEAFIWSEDAINFMWELPLLGDNSFGAVAYQHLLNTRIANILSSTHLLNQPVQMKGDDMMVLYQEDGVNIRQGKCSVSITYVKDNAALGHTGININAGNNAPDFAFSTRLSDRQIVSFVSQVLAEFEQLNQEIFVATSKIIVK